jgi:hypothetical protein
MTIELGPEQRMRLSALRAARDFLEGSTREYDMPDLISIASWIGTGKDPYDRDRPPPVSPDAAEWRAT